MQFQQSRAFALELDAKDTLAPFRNAFLIPEQGGKKVIYFLGNSLGLQPKSTTSLLQQVMDQWQRWGVEGFFRGDQPWLQYHDKLTGPLSKIIGAKPEEVVVMNSLTVNLHLMLVTTRYSVKLKPFHQISICWKLM